MLYNYSTKKRKIKTKLISHNIKNHFKTLFNVLYMYSILNNYSVSLQQNKMNALIYKKRRPET